MIKAATTLISTRIGTNRTGDCLRSRSRVIAFSFYLPLFVPRVNHANTVAPREPLENGSPDLPSVFPMYYISKVMTRTFFSLRAERAFRFDSYVLASTGQKERERLIARSGDFRGEKSMEITVTRMGQCVCNL